MNQEITISHSTISYLANNLPTIEINNAQRIIEHLRENLFVVDSKYEFPKLLWEETNKIGNDDLRKYMQKLLENLYTQKKAVINSNFENEEILAQESIDQIFLDPLLDPKSIKKISKQYPIEVHNEQSFVNPSTYQKLKHSQCKLVFEKEIIYDFKRIFEPYLRETKNLSIENPFLPNPSAMHNFRLLIELFSGSTIKIKLHSEYNYLKHNPVNKQNYIELQTYFKMLKSNGLKISISYYEKRKHYERYIYTNSVRIKLPGGLDFLDKDGKISSSEDFVEVEVSAQQNKKAI